MDKEKPKPKDPIFIFNNHWFVLRTLMVPTTKEDGLMTEHFK